MRYVWHPELGVIPKTDLRPKSGIVMIKDIKPFRTQDGVEITSRRALREYEKRNNVRQIGNDWPGDPEYTTKPADFDEWKNR